MNLAHGDRLEWLVGQLAKYGGRVEPDLGALRHGEAGVLGRSVVAQHVVHRRLKIGVAESFHHNAVHARNLAVDRIRSVDTDDRPDSNWRIERSPEMKFVRSVGTPLGGHDTTKQQTTNEIALRNSSVSRIP